jgi:hypothetical protein
MWNRYKPVVTKLVMWSIKNHWIGLVVLIGTMYITGNAMAEANPYIPLSYSMLFTIHSWTGKLVLITAVFLALEKLYLWLLRNKRL